jgi:hypothetical protein
VRSPTTWRKSTRSPNGATCVELANTLDAIRDSKNSGPLLRANITALVHAVKRDRFHEA